VRSAQIDSLEALVKLRCEKWVLTQNDEEKADGETMRAAADIDEGCQWQLGHSTYDISDQTNHGCQAMFLERARDEGSPCKIGLLLK
jgi:hypothetical protein